MPTIQTYEARNIREGYRAYLGLHYGTVLHDPEPDGPGTVEITIRCEYHPDEEEIFPVPAHSAVHAERSL